MDIYRIESGRITPPPEQTPKVDIIIVGAGLSGLVSAKKIMEKERSLQVKVLEASSAIGGQITSTMLGEMGGRWISQDQYHINQLVQQLKVPTSQRQVTSPALQRCWDIDRGIFAPLANYELQRYIQELELKVPFFKPGRVSDRKGTSKMKDHICNRLFFNKSRQFMLNLVKLVCGVDAQEINFMEFMSICYGCGGLQKLIDVYIECPKSLLEISSAHLLKSLMDSLPFTQFVFWRKVQEIRHFKDYVEVLDSQDEIHTADVVILAIPSNSVQDILIDPPVPSQVMNARTSERKKPTMITSFMAKYSTGFWRLRGFSGNFLSNEPMIFGYEYRPTVYCGLTVHEEGIEPLVRSMALQTLAEHYGEQMMTPIQFYQRTFRASALQHAPLTTPWNRIIWSSSAAASTCYRGFLNGAVQSGLRAAMNALLVVRPQTVSWQDIAELQCPNGPSDKDVGMLELWISELNLYNVTYYSIFVYTMFTVLRYFYVKPN